MIVCAACPGGGGTVPPRLHAAHQMELEIMREWLAGGDLWSSDSHVPCSAVSLILQYFLLLQMTHSNQEKKEARLQPAIRG